LGGLSWFNVVDKGNKCSHAHLIARFAEKREKLSFKLVEKNEKNVKACEKKRKDDVEQASYHT